MVLAQWGLVGVGWATVFSVVWVQNHGTLRKDGARGLTLHDQEPGPFQLMVICRCVITPQEPALNHELAWNQANKADARGGGGTEGGGTKQDR